MNTRHIFRTIRRGAETLADLARAARRRPAPPDLTPLLAGAETRAPLEGALARALILLSGLADADAPAPPLLDGLVLLLARCRALSLPRPARENSNTPQAARAGEAAPAPDAPEAALARDIILWREAADAWLEEKRALTRRLARGLEKDAENAGELMERARALFGELWEEIEAAFLPEARASLAEAARGVLKGHITIEKITGSEKSYAFSEFYTLDVSSWAPENLAQAIYEALRESPAKMAAAALERLRAARPDAAALLEKERPEAAVAEALSVLQGSFADCLSESNVLWQEAADNRGEFYESREEAAAGREAFIAHLCGEYAGRGLADMTAPLKALCRQTRDAVMKSDLEALVRLKTRLAGLEEMLARMKSAKAALRTIG